jgi:hypothetical protein
MYKKDRFHVRGHDVEAVVHQPQIVAQRGDRGRCIGH